MHFRVYSRYFFSKLSAGEKEAYKQLLDSWYSYGEKVVISGISSGSELQRVADALHDDIPELFYVDFGGISYRCGKDTVTVETKYKYLPARTEKIKADIAAALAAFKQKNQGRDMLKAIHDHLVQNVRYSEDLNAPRAHDICGAMLYGDAVCEGYARAFKLMCDEMGIPCIVVGGVVQSLDDGDELHAWNMVHYNGENYHVDVTWDSTIFHSGHDVPVYFCVSDAFISKNHTWKKDKWPSCKVSGDFEKEIIDVVGLKTFSAALGKVAAARKKTFVLRFNKKFSSPKEIADLIDKAVKRNIVRITYVSVSYIEKLDCAIIEFKY